MDKKYYFAALFLILTVSLSASAIDMSAIEALRNKQSTDASKPSPINNSGSNEVLEQPNLRLQLKKDKVITVIREGKAFAGDKLSQAQLIERALVDAKVSIANELCADELDIATTKDGNKLIKVSSDSNEYKNASTVKELSTSIGNIVFSSVKPIEGSQKYDRGDFIVKVEIVITLNDVKKTVSLVSFQTDDTIHDMRQDLIHQFESHLSANPKINIVTVADYFNTSTFQIHASLESSHKDKDRGLFRRPQRKYNVQINVRLVDTSNGNKTDLFTAVGEAEQKVEEIFDSESYKDKQEKAAINYKTDRIGYKEAALAAIKNFCDQLQTKKIF